MGRFTKKTAGPRRPRTQVEAGNRAPTFSYRANRMPSDQLSGKRGQEVKRRRTPAISWRQLPSIFISLTMFVCFFYLTTLSSDPRIADQVVSTQKSSLLREPSVYRQAAQRILERSLVNKSKITFNSSDFDKRMRAEFPEISATAVTLPIMGRRPVVELVIARPQIVLVTAQGSYLVDGQGRAVADAKDIKNLEKLSLPTVGEQAGTTVKLGEGVLPSQTVTFITTFVTQLASRGIKVTSITLPQAASEVQVRFEGAAYALKASLLTDPRQSAGAFLATKKRLDAENIVPSEYVDVRVEEKVFYK